ncbi:hypothetical protein FJT64_014350 [Amphibalanus amphitrite]|uniref:G-protein coupled receptors family 1 profile domain-containing protein n=1 Tax=Amphibalanus amphitrite TaxID=1232801 RepID=A0A6A4V6G2_AMPAM|nr:hypothetical protein FJT64_014350 [Amphibalanus amphitrite]
MSLQLAYNQLTALRQSVCLFCTTSKSIRFNALSAMTLLRTRCLKTLCNRLVLIFCLVDTALSLLFPTIQLVSWTVKESSQAAELAWLAELTCAPRRFVYEVSTNARFSLVVSIALLRYLVVCRSINPAPTQRNILRASLPGLALALARTINNQLTLTSYCSQAYAVTESGFLIPSLSYNINTNISSMTNGFRILTLGGGILIIVFCYGRQTPQLRPAPAPAGPSSAAPEAASSVPVLRVSALNYDVMTSVTLLLHLMVFMLAFLPTVLAMSLLFDRRACYQTPLQHQVLSFCLILLFLVQTSLNTPLLLLFSGQFRAALRALLRDIVSKLR